MKKVGRLLRENMVTTVKDGIKNCPNTFLINYTSISSSEMSDFRKSLYQIGAQLFVSRNTVAKRALEELELKDFSRKIINQTAFVWSDADAVDVAKVLAKIEKGCKGFSIQAGLSEGKLLDKNDVQRLSDLPSREILLSMLLSAIQSPLTRLAGALNAKTRDLLSILKQLSEQKGGK